MTVGDVPADDVRAGDVHAGEENAGEENAEPDHWHRALGYAVTGRRLDLGRQGAPAVRALAVELQSQVDVEVLAADVRASLERGEVWPHPVPADLAAGLGPAQFAAALQLLTRELGLEVRARPVRVGRVEPPTPAVRRLLDEVPPHHGG